MIRGLLYSIFIATLFSCASKDKVPEKIIQPQKMQAILWDIMSAQNLAANNSRSDSTVREVSLNKALSQKVFEIHKTTPADFNNSYNWYLKHPEMLKVMLDSLHEQKQREVSTEAKERDLRDSLNNKEPVI